MKKNMYLYVAVVMIFLLCSGCGRDTKTSVFELEQDGPDTVSSQDGQEFQMDREEWKALLEEAVASLEVNPVIQVTCDCTGATQVQQIAAGSAPQMQQGPVADGRVNINTADAAALQELNGIGASRAQAIIAYRENCGNFQTIEDIMQVEGIKEGVFSKIKDEISVG